MTRRLTRRTLLGVAAVAPVGLSAACSTDDLRPTAPPTPAAPVNPDQAIVDRLTASIAKLAASAPAPWSAAHAAQLAALGATPATAATSSNGAADLTAERALRTNLADGCLAASDATLARLLASMAAGVAQLLAAA